MSLKYFLFAQIFSFFEVSRWLKIYLKDINSVFLPVEKIMVLISFNIIKILYSFSRVIVVLNASSCFKCFLVLLNRKYGSIFYTPCFWRRNFW